MNRPNNGYPAWKLYWETRLGQNPNLCGTGHRQFSLAYNEAMYQVATKNLEAVLARNKLDLTGKQILDIGPGSGYFVQKYLEWGAAHVTGVDIADMSVQLLQQAFPQHAFVQGDISHKTFAMPVQYDLVTAISVIFHIVEDVKFKQALTNMCNAVRPGGHLLLVDAFHQPAFLTAQHVRLRSLNHYIPSLEAHQIEICVLHPMYYLMGKTFIPFIGPKLLSHPAVLRLLLKLEHWLSTRIPPPPGWLQYLIARRQVT